MTFWREHDRALGWGGRHNHGQHLGRQPHSHRQREQESLWPVTLGKAIEQQHDGHHDQRKADQQP